MVSRDTIDYILFEEAAGYALFKVILQPSTIGSRLPEVQEAANDVAKFRKLLELVSFAPFQTAAQALENANDVSEGIVSDYLKAILEQNIPRTEKPSKEKIVLGISDKNLGPSIKDALPWVEPVNSEVVQDILRGIRNHGVKLLKDLQQGDLERSQLGLAHAYSRSKVKFSVNKNDNHIIQAIALIDQLDKDINTFSMRVKEWYGWHFPELAKIENDNLTYAKLVLFIKDKATLSQDKLHDLAALVNEDSGLAERIIEAARISMGQDISETDMDNIVTFAQRVANITEYRKRLFDYLSEKMHTVAPNLSELIGEVVGARLISHAGSLTNLSKYPASTVQILGAEKALFRALKTKGNTPKYGLIYHSSFIGKAGAKNKGRISRFLANKCSIASRIDNYSETPTNKFGEVLKRQVEERLEYFDTGKPPIKNSEAMKLAIDEIGVPSVAAEAIEEVKEVKEDKKEKKEKKDKKEKKEKKDKKEKKEKKRSLEDDESAPKKKKKKSKD
ncbi:uncharacterized protein SAPINGB_P000825 [Magnusiomyces paraingens]|uniref:Nucleolar protein 56 n=1 Tax=Magnusiomyces paraingens TaxID=2606893 RepID=A0A5E8B355_9ASCO|nr:uncharacterized protein SAPINGB_P000825 [Saprochaete ingens]VVT45649.1 unnamed protein product [Saprochaete ingens]